MPFVVQHVLAAHNFDILGHPKNKTIKSKNFKTIYLPMMLQPYFIHHILIKPTRHSTTLSLSWNKHFIKMKNQLGALESQLKIQVWLLWIARSKNFNQNYLLLCSSLESIQNTIRVTPPMIYLDPQPQHTQYFFTLDHLLSDEPANRIPKPKQT